MAWSLAAELVALRDPTTRADFIRWGRARALAGEGVRGLGGQGEPLAKGFPIPPRLFLTTLRSSLAATQVQINSPIRVFIISH